MDKAQEFIKQCLFVKNFDDPNKPIDEGRLRDTLLILPTDGGVTSRLKQNRSSLKLTSDNIIKNAGGKIRHDNYKTINKNSKRALQDFINHSRRMCQKAKKIAYERKLLMKDELTTYLQINEPELWSTLPHYSNYIPMYRDLWLNYIKEVLNIPRDIKEASKLSINGNNALLKLSMAEYNGAKLKVTMSKNPNLIGMEGIVIWDSQKSFIMCKKGTLVDELKIIPKKGTVFEFQIPVTSEEALQYSILGDRFKYRSSDRAGRKFKSRRVDDMLFYVQ